MFELVEKGGEAGGPDAGGNGFAMVILGDSAEGTDTQFKVWDEAGVEVEETDEGVERLAGFRQGPVGDEVELGRGWAIAVRSKVETDPLHAVEEEVAFLGVEGEAPFGEDMANT